jgi:hypothetical protein
MSKFDDEFKDVKKGLPSEETSQKASVNFVLLFFVVGLIAAVVILVFKDLIITGGAELSKNNGYVPEQILLNGLLSLLVASIQSWVFKSKIRSRIHVYILFAVIGGIIAGLIGGVLIDMGLEVPFLIGGINGAITGGVSSLGQSQVMGNEKYRNKWFLYSVFSWSSIFAVGWVIGWHALNIMNLAFAAMFLMIASGISLAFFINTTPQIEFS